MAILLLSLEAAVGVLMVVAAEVTAAVLLVHKVETAAEAVERNLLVAAVQQVVLLVLHYKVEMVMEEMAVLAAEAITAEAAADKAVLIEVLEVALVISVVLKLMVVHLHQVVLVQVELQSME